MKRTLLYTFQTVATVKLDGDSKGVRDSIARQLNHPANSRFRVLKGFVSWDTFRIWQRGTVFGWYAVACEGQLRGDSSLQLRFAINGVPLHIFWVLLALLFGVAMTVLMHATEPRDNVVSAISMVGILYIFGESVRCKRALEKVVAESL